ncbi:GGDEF domain-containing protein [Salinisphaera aquimarina]|uniref:diguanylate cyclase n=1 Tax=Salinisphaera aquimarina TaxID=2094031 RepID=A0ABV7EMP7_9GAMM
MATASFALQATVAAVAAALNGVAWSAAITYIVGLSALVVIFFCVFRSGLNLRAKEPNLTFVQVLSPLLPALYLLCHIDSLPVRAGVLLTVIVPLLYGILDLSIRRFLAAALAYFVTYFAVFLLVGARNLDHYANPDEWIVLITLALLLVQIGFIGGFISGLRGSLRRKNQQLNAAMEKISDMAVRDELTGIYNRRRLMEVLQSEVARSARGDAQFSVCLFDLDDFKQINDSHGHPMGDQVLTACAQAVAGMIRSVDTFGRFGGEEFLLIMPMTHADAASIAGNRLRARIAGLQFLDDEGRAFNITASIGIATSSRDASRETGAILQRVDEALYAAKAAGRNCVKLANNHD